MPERSGTTGTGPCRLLIVNGLEPETSADLYDDVAVRLRARGLVAGVVHSHPEPPLAPTGSEWPDEWDVVVTNRDRDDASGIGAATFGGRRVSRPESLGWLEDAGVPTMEWAVPASRLAVMKLFRRWDVDRLILKPSYTFGGTDVCVFTRRSVPRMQWDRDVDVVCREVDPDDGTVFKVELLAGVVLIGWKSVAPPIRDQLPGGRGKGLPGAYGERSLWEPPPELRRRLCALSDTLTSSGFSHVSVDLMRSPDGTFVAIELNPRSVATWWTRQFEAFRARYADALHRLALGACPH